MPSGASRRYHLEMIRLCNELLRLPEAIDAMTDWGDAVLNETARPRSMPLPPDAPAALSPAAAQARVAVAEIQPAALEPPTSRVDHGVRIIPEPGKGGS
jgi:hypothetical protein